MAADVGEIRSDLADHAWIAANGVTAETRALAMHQQFGAASRIAVDVRVSDIRRYRRIRPRVRGHAVDWKSDEARLCHCRLRRRGARWHADARRASGRDRRRIGTRRMADRRISTEVALG